jgi:internalin A
MSRKLLDRKEGNKLNKIKATRNKIYPDIAEYRIQQATLYWSEQLDLSDLNLTVLPESIGNLTQLQTLIIRGNNFTTFPEIIFNLSSLQYLDLSNNRLTSLPESIDRLTQLKSLDLDFNQLTTLPESLRLLNNLNVLNLHGNTKLGILPEILVSGRSNASIHISAQLILDYYFRSRGELQRPLNEVKLLLVGSGGSGKTSIVLRLRKNSFNPSMKETRGITINTWNITCRDDDIKVNVWDFAGQVITHATHQFFLTHRSVYILVLTGREDSQKTDAEYWLRLIKAFGTDRYSGETSPVIVALNKWDSTQFKVDRYALKEKYPFIVEFVETDCATRTGIEHLKEILSSTIDSMDNVHTKFPASWWKIKEQIEALQKNYLSYNEYRKLCVSQGETDQSAQASLSYVLHALGIALNYSDDRRLQDTTVLNPHWVTDGIYRLLRQAARDDGSGEMHMDDVARVLPNEQQEMRYYLVELMRRFDLAFPLTEDRQHWLVPQRLLEEQPELEMIWSGTSVTRLRYRYPVLPEGLLPRFITRTYPLSTGLPRWLNGVILEDDGARGLVRADISERIVSVAVCGNTEARRWLAGLIRGDLKSIHDDIEGLNPIEEIELEESSGVYVSLRTLEADERKKQKSSASTDDGTVAVNNTLELNRVSAPEARDPKIWKAKLFISYSSTDSKLHDELIVRLKPLLSEGLVESWSDRCLIPGQRWDKEIRRQLAEADMVIFLQSATFVASDYIQDVEVAQALQQKARGRTEIVSIILEKCDWMIGKHGSQLKEYQALPPKAMPIRDTSPQRNAWHEVAKGLRKTLEDIRQHRSSEKSSPDFLI